MHGHPTKIELNYSLMTTINNSVYSHVTCTIHIMGLDLLHNMIIVDGRAKSPARIFGGIYSIHVLPHIFRWHTFVTK